MGRFQRSVIKIGQDLAIDFANTAGPASHPAGALGSWRDLVDFVELRSAVSRSESAALRAMGERDARACAAALDQARLPKSIDFSIDYLLPGRPETTYADCDVSRAGVRVAQWGPRRLRAVTHLDVTRGDVERAAKIIRETLA